MGGSDSFTEQYLDSLTSGSGGGGSQPSPLSFEDIGSAITDGAKNVAERVSDGVKGVIDEMNDVPDPEDLGKAAATRDFQTAAGKGWEYDDEAMKNQINRLSDIRNHRLGPAIHRTDQSETEPPGDEDVSDEYVQIVNWSLDSHATQLTNYQKYLDAYIETLQKVDRAYRDQDEDAKNELLSKDV